MTLLRWISFLSVGASLVLPGSAQGQEIDGVGPGSRVRVTSPAILMWTAEGLITENSDGWLGLETGQGEMRLPVGSVTRVQTSLGERRRTVRGAVMGILAGVAAAALIIGADTADGVIDPECGELHCFGYGFRTALMGAGLAVGSLVGYTWRTEEWGDIPVRSTSVGLVKNHHGRSGLQIGLGFGW